jgi:hypothetical protein
MQTACAFDRSRNQTAHARRDAADCGEYSEAAQIAAIDNSGLAIMAHHPILDHNDTAGSLDHQPNSEGLYGAK